MKLNKNIKSHEIKNVKVMINSIVKTNLTINWINKSSQHN